MSRVNIVFQVQDPGAPHNWHKSKIAKVLQNVPRDMDVEPILLGLSDKYPDQVIRIARLNIDETISVEQANRHDGGYWQSR
ncbi:MAG: hypothetical protein A3K54_00180 [Omnitrophica WOR_2 bacterium RBG_13_44_8]|nr:MAG: hypothetical protein A3K54_00180 [Omnitrophica WOR_2 bacterium RBG_13_44_8]